jgi:hypothetical protein
MRFYSISEVAQIVSKTDDRRLVRQLLKRHRIETHQVGKRAILDEMALAALKQAIAEWNSQTRVGRPPSKN